MAKAKKVKELFVVTPNEVGMLGKVTHAISSQGVNIETLCAYGVPGKNEANFMIVTGDNETAAKKLKERGYEVKEKEVLSVEFDNKPGTLEPVAKRLGDSGIDINYVYGTTADGAKVIGIFDTKDNDKAEKVINE